MSITNHQAIQCDCGVTLRVLVADSINADRHPHLRLAILEGTFHRFICACGRSLVVDTPFTYLDHARRQLFFVVPRGDLAAEADVITQVRESYELSFGPRAPVGVQRLGHGLMVRLCFGLVELRDKLVADDAGLNDVLVEELKCIVLATQPMLSAAHVHALWLDRVEDETLVLLAESDAVDRQRAIHVPRALYDSLAREGAERILARRPLLVSGPHVSAMRLGLA